jgi:hypothetical protein
VIPAGWNWHIRAGRFRAAHVLTDHEVRRVEKEVIATRWSSGMRDALKRPKRQELEADVVRGFRGGVFVSRASLINPWSMRRRAARESKDISGDVHSDDCRKNTVFILRETP